MKPKLMATSENTRSALMVTALSVEYQAVRSHLANLAEHVHPHGTVYETGSFDAGNGVVWEVSVVEIGPGNPGAALETERAIAYLKPSVAFFVGIAGGIKDVELCDVVAATRVYGYECGKQRKLFEPRPNVGESSYSLVQRARAEARKENWLKRLKLSAPRKPRSLLGPIAAGEKVLASTTADLLKFLRHNYGDALAVEMEGRGFLQAAHANQAVSALIVRGVSDLIDAKSQCDREGYQLFASDCASAFAFEILANLERPLGSRVGRYFLVLSGSISEKDRPRVEAIVNHLRSLSEDAHLTLERLEAGSVKLLLLGSNEGYERLRTLQQSGALSHALGLTVLSLGEFEELASDAPEADRELNQILLDARRGIPSALETFLERVFPMLHQQIWHSLRRFMPNATWVDVQDSVQKALIRAFQRFASFQGVTVGEFMVWVSHIARHAVVDSMRRQMAMRWSPLSQEWERSSEMLLPDILVDPSGSPREAAEAAEFTEMLARAIKQLPLRERQIVLLTYFDELPCSAIAERLGITQKSVRMSLYRARHQLRRELQRHFDMPVRGREVVETGKSVGISDLQVQSRLWATEVATGFLSYQEARDRIQELAPEMATVFYHLLTIRILEYIERSDDAETRSRLSALLDRVQADSSELGD